jgi:hypothetical protein
MLRYPLNSGRWKVKLGLKVKLSSIWWEMECKAWANVKAIFYIVEDGIKSSFTFHLPLYRR